MRSQPPTAPGDPDGDLFLNPPGAAALLVLAHGSGAGPRHAFMEGLARTLAGQGVATLRFTFPYMAAGRAFPDRPPVLVAALVEAVARARVLAPDLPLFVGGKSLGGRMASTAVAEGALNGGAPGTRGRAGFGGRADAAGLTGSRGPANAGEVRGLIFFGFPLHSAGKPARARAEHLHGVPLPMLFLQGDRDALADLELLRPEVDALGGRAILHVVPGADHGFHVLKRSGRTDDEVLLELARVSAGWIRSVLGVRMA